MGLGDIVDDKKDDTDSTSNTGGSSSSSSSRPGSDQEAPGNDLFKEVAEFDPDSGEVPMCPKCEKKGEIATNPKNGQNLYYYRCTTHYDECDVLQYVYSTRKERFVHSESDPLQKKIIQQEDDKEDDEESEQEQEKSSTMEEWDDFLEGVELE